MDSSTITDYIFYFLAGASIAIIILSYLYFKTSEEANIIKHRDPNDRIIYDAVMNMFTDLRGKLEFDRDDMVFKETCFVHPLYKEIKVIVVHSEQAYSAKITSVTIDPLIKLTESEYKHLYKVIRDFYANMFTWNSVLEYDKKYIESSERKEIVVDYINVLGRVYKD
jgi:hypothetical protein